MSIMWGLTILECPEIKLDLMHFYYFYQLLLRFPSVSKGAAREIALKKSKKRLFVRCISLCAPSN